MYTQPFNKIGKVEPKLRNQSKSSLRMNYATPLTKPGDLDKDTRLQLEASAELAKKNLGEAVASKQQGGLYDGKEVTVAKPAPKKLPYDAFEQEYRTTAKEITGKQFGYYTNQPGDVKVSEAERIATGLSMDRDRMSQLETFQKKYGKGAQPAQPFIGENVGGSQAAKAQTAKERQIRSEMNYAAAEPIKIKTAGIHKQTAQEINPYQTRQTLEKVLPTFEKGQSGTFVKGQSEVRVQRNDRGPGDNRQFRSYTRGTSGELSKATKQRVRKTGKYYSGPQTLTDITKKHSKADFVKKGTNPYLPLN